jgi:hypothetical protein
MDTEINALDEEQWDGVEQRESRRRYTIDRRSSERRKRYWWSVIFPIVLGAVLSALISWGVYVTHITYKISANYEETFVSHIEKELERDAQVEHKLEMMKTDYSNRMNLMRSDMSSGLKEIRDMQASMYRLLLDHERTRAKSEEPKQR